MSLTADLLSTPGRADRPGDRDRSARRQRRAAADGPGGITRGDVVRLSATLAAVGGLLGVLTVSAGSGPPADGRRTLETSYGLVALGRVTVEAVTDPAQAGAALRVTVPVTLHNLSDEPVHYGPEHFRLRTSTAVVRPEVGPVRTGDVAPDGAVQLRLVFELPPTAQARLTVDDARLTGGLRVPLPPAVVPAP